MGPLSQSGSVPAWCPESTLRPTPPLVRQLAVPPVDEGNKVVSWNAASVGLSVIAVTSKFE